MASLSLTVQVPFRGPFPIIVQPYITARALCEVVSSVVPPLTENETSRANATGPAASSSSAHAASAGATSPAAVTTDPDPIAQCLVYQGRVIPDDTTLADAAVPNGAVLHIMRRPTPGRPTSSPRQTASEEEDGDLGSFTFSMVYGPDGMVAQGVQQGDMESVPGEIIEMLSARMGAQRQPPTESADRPDHPHHTDRSEHPDRAEGPARGFFYHVEHNSRHGHYHHHVHRHDYGPDDQHSHDHQHDHQHHSHHHDHYPDHLHDHHYAHHHDHHHDHHHRDDEHEHGHGHGHAHTHYYVFGANEQTNPVEFQSPNQTNIFFVHRTGDSPTRYVDAYDVVAYALNALGYNTHAQHRAALVAAAIAVATRPAEERNTPSFSVLENAWAEARRAQEQIMPASGTEGSDRALVPQAMPTAPPGAVSTEVSVGRQGARALLPSLAEMLRLVATQIENMNHGDLFEADRREQADALIEQLGALGTTLPSTTALLSSLMPVSSDPSTRVVSSNSGQEQEAGRVGPDHTESESAGPQQRSPILPSGTGNQSGQTQEHDEESCLTNAQLDRENTVDHNSVQQGGSSIPPSGTHWVSDEPQERREESGSANPHVNSIRQRLRDTNGDNDDGAGQLHSSSVGHSAVEPNNPAPPSSIPAQLPGGSSLPPADPGYGDGEDPAELSPRTEGEKSANADFCVRLMAYYLKSFTEDAIPIGMGPPSSVSLSADSVLDGMFGNSDRPAPREGVLRIVQRVMKILSPQQFHDIVRGDFRALNSLDINIWDVVREHLHGSFPQSVSEEEMVDLVIDAVCDALHTFIHLLQNIHNRTRRSPEYLTRSVDLCETTMSLMHEKARWLADLLKGQHDNPMFGSDLFNLLRIAVTEICSVLQYCFDGSPELIVDDLRRAVFSVGEHVVGQQFSVIFPMLVNLYSSRVWRMHLRLIENSAERRNMSLRFLRNDRRQESSSAIPIPDMRSRTSLEVTHDDEGLPDLVEEDLETTDEDSWSAYDDEEVTGSDVSEDEANGDVLSEDDGYSEEYTDDEDNTDGNDPHVSIYGKSASTQAASIEEVDLDEHELAELATELVREHSSEDRAPISGELLDDFDDLAEELEIEQTQSKESKKTEKPTKLTMPSGSKRMAGMSSAFASAMGPPGLASGLASSRISTSSGIGRPGFSSIASAPRGRRLQDEFDQVMGAQEGALWRRAVELDEDRIRRSVHGPLSRGYRNESSPVAELDAESAVLIGLEDARAACREARLSNEATRSVENALQENGALYLREFETALRSRLASDPDLDPERFPAAVRRFGPFGQRFI